MSIRKITPVKKAHKSVPAAKKKVTKKATPKRRPVGGQH